MVGENELLVRENENFVRAHFHSQTNDDRARGASNLKCHHRHFHVRPSNPSLIVSGSYCHALLRLKSHAAPSYRPHQADGFGKSAAALHPRSDEIAQSETLRRRQLEIERERAIATARHVLSQRLFVGGEDADALPAAGNAHVPLLSSSWPPGSRNLRRERDRPFCLATHTT